MEPRTPEIILHFILALMEKDRDRLNDTLSDMGKYTIMNYQFTLVQSNKFLFVDWLFERLQTVSINNYIIDNDVQAPHHTVVLFNDGQFPAIHTELDEPFLTGLGIIHDEHKIDEVYFCHEFNHTPNFTIKEKMELDMQKLILSGMDETLARTTIFGR